MQSRNIVARVLWVLTVVVALGGFLATSALAKSPLKKPDESWVTISGTVESVRPNAFTLDYGKGMVTVEMDDGDRDAEAYKLLRGDKVSVTGKIDDDLFEKKSIEAAAVHLEKFGTTFFSSAADEEDLLFAITTPVVLSAAAVQGTVSSVGNDEFVVNTGARKVTVEVGDMSDNPLDNQGFMKIKKGDFVRVAGKMDYDFLEGRALEADSIVKIISTQKKRR